MGDFAHMAQEKIWSKITAENCIIRCFVVFITHKTAYDKTKKKWVEQVAWLRKTKYSYEILVWNPKRKPILKTLEKTRE